MKLIILRGALIKHINVKGNNKISEGSKVYCVAECGLIKKDSLFYKLLCVIPDQLRVAVV